MKAGHSIGDGGAAGHAHSGGDHQPAVTLAPAGPLNGDGAGGPAAFPPAAQQAYPFAAIVGMADLKLALLLNAVSPAIGGVLVRGEKGTAKSTVVRGLAALLPAVDVVADCRFGCDPAAPDPGCPDGPHPGQPARLARPARLAELPVGATEDRLAGSLDIERALTDGVAAFEPGLLAAAHRGLLYVDEVNLLHDHLVDLLLDAAALGVNYVEREGLSVRHAARFLLVGTMNPEEGELRPQLLDRFGLTVEVTATREPPERAEVVRRRLAYEANPVAFAADFDLDSERIAGRVVAARERLPTVRLPDSVLQQICSVCAAFEVDGLRADLVMARTAIALAAWHDRDEVGADDVRQAARLALPHRRRRDPFDVPGLDEQALDEALADALDAATPPPGGEAAGGTDRGQPGDGPDDSGPDDSSPGGSAPDGPDDSDPDGGGPDDGGGPPPRPGGQAPDDRGEARPGTAQDPGQRQAGAPAPGAPEAARGQSASGATEPFRPRLLTVTGIGQGAPGRRSAARTPYGRVTGARLPHGRVHSVHLPATLRAAAPRAGRARQKSLADRAARAATVAVARQDRAADRAAATSVGHRAAASSGRGERARGQRPACRGGRGCGSGRPTCGRPSGSAGKATWCSSPSTPAARWRPGTGCAPSRARCSPCSSMPTSAGTRSAWSRSAAPRPSWRCRRRPRWRPGPGGWPCCRPAAVPRWRPASRWRPGCCGPNASGTPTAGPCW